MYVETTIDAATSTTSQPKKTISQRLNSVHTRELLAGYAFITPAFLALLIFLVGPILASIVLIFMEYDILTPPQWVGTQNLERLVTDKRMFLTYWNSLIFVLGATFLNNVLGLMLAMSVNRAMHSTLKYLFRTAIFFPVLTTTASLALVWSYLLTQDRGVVNYLLQSIGLDPVAWLSSSQWALRSVIVYDVWKSVGFLMVLYLAGLQGIPQVLYEVAEIDGASRWQMTRFVTLPLITPTAFFRHRHLIDWRLPGLRQCLGSHRRWPRRRLETDRSLHL
jgi:multiple sugar transport system permease protein